MEENEVLQCRWENFTNVYINYVTIQWPNLKLWPLIRVRTFTCCCCCLFVVVVCCCCCLFGGFFRCIYYGTYAYSWYLRLPNYYESYGLNRVPNWNVNMSFSQRTFVNYANKVFHYGQLQTVTKKNLSNQKLYFWNFFQDKFNIIFSYWLRQRLKLPNKLWCSKVV